MQVTATLTLSQVADIIKPSVAEEMGLPAEAITINVSEGPYLVTLGHDAMRDLKPVRVVEDYTVATATGMKDGTKLEATLDLAEVLERVKTAVCASSVVADANFANHHQERVHLTGIRVTGAKLAVPVAA